jgi:hypothetical protein
MSGPRWARQLDMIPHPVESAQRCSQGSWSSPRGPARYFSANWHRCIARSAARSPGRRHVLSGRSDSRSRSDSPCFIQNRSQKTGRKPGARLHNATIHLTIGICPSDSLACLLDLGKIDIHKQTYHIVSYDVDDAASPIVMGKGRKSAHLSYASYAEPTVARVFGESGDSSGISGDGRQSLSIVAAYQVKPLNLYRGAERICPLDARLGTSLTRSAQSAKRRSVSESKP